ncbi:hypothetical protein [Streptomyces sp. NPDC088727]|uniref:hypothetical protein n=1 Tax=Streptomyces sp. NPDC088727 TaxID=3365875 RepID=UPI003829C116
MSLLSHRYYLSPDGLTWTCAGKGREEMPEVTSVQDYARKLVHRLAEEIPGDDALRVRVWVGELTDDDAEAEVDVDYHWRDDVPSLLANVERRRKAVNLAEERARDLEAQAKAARAAVKRERDGLALAAYHASRGGAEQTAIVKSSGHERNWVRTTVRTVEARQAG